MQTMPRPTESETQDNAAFGALLWALSLPGVPRLLPVPGEASIIAAIVDRECRAYAAHPQLVPQIRRTGAKITELHHADHVFLGALTSIDVLGVLAIGSDLYPDGGATVVIRARIGAGQAFRFSGPGIDGETVVQLDGLPEGFWAARAERIRYPMGFELYCVDGAQVLGVPRSTVVEVL